MKECVNPTELTAELLNTLIEKIVVHEAVKGEDGSREQEVEIFYRVIPAPPTRTFPLSPPWPGF